MFIDRRTAAFQAADAGKMPAVRKRETPAAVRDRVRLDGLLAETERAAQASRTQ